MSAIKSSGKMSVNYLHSFALTEHYYVYVEQPLFINIFKVLTSKLLGMPISKCVEWWPDVKVSFQYYLNFNAIKEPCTSPCCRWVDQ